tara:strand:+ start:618 stop:1313 length:696 start_codon:yes stop_codon:yes gene_type:complete
MATFYTGNTGRSFGPHLDFRVWDVEKGSYIDPRPFTGYLKVGDTALTEQFPVTSPYGKDRGTYIHKGIDYGTPVGTQVEIPGAKFLTTTNDASGGGISSQYAITGKDGRKYEILLMHGSDQNKILSNDFMRDDSPLDGGLSTPVKSETGSTTSSDYPSGIRYAFMDSGSDVATPDTDGGTTANRMQAAERIKAYQDLSKSQLEAEYDKLRAADANTAAIAGMEMHKAYFNK